MSTGYPEVLAALIPYLRRFGQQTEGDTRRAIEERASPEEVDFLVKHSMNLLADAATGVQAALSYADELAAEGRVDEAERLRAFVAAIMPVPG